MNDEQYKLISVRRNAQNQILWQVPALASAGQGFLLVTAFNPLIPPAISIGTAIFSLIVGLAAMQLMAKHRYLELRDSEHLYRFEKENAGKGYSVLHGPITPMEGIRANWFVRASSFRLWIAILGGFCLLALLAVYSAIARNNLQTVKPISPQPSATKPQN